MEALAGILRSRPQLVDLAILVCVTAHFAAFLVIPEFWFYLSPFAREENQNQVHDLYLGLLGPASIIAGLAGVVITFALSSPSERFKKLRANGGKALQRTWISSSLSAMVAVVASITASTVLIFGQPAIATFAFEAAIMFLLHGAIRLLWILYKLIGVQRIEDRVESDKSNTFKLKNLPASSSGTSVSTD